MGLLLIHSLCNKVEHLLESSNICLLNDKSPTYFHPATGSFTSIDLSSCSASVFLDFTWQVHSDQCGSDHFPILIDVVKSMPKDNVPRWNLNRLIGQNLNFSVLSILISIVLLTQQKNFLHF